MASVVIVDPMSIASGDAEAISVLDIAVGVPVPAMTGRAHASLTAIPFDDPETEVVDVLVAPVDPQALSIVTARIDTDITINRIRPLPIPPA